MNDRKSKSTCITIDQFREFFRDNVEYREDTSLKLNVLNLASEHVTNTHTQLIGPPAAICRQEVGTL